MLRGPEYSCFPRKLIEMEGGSLHSGELPEAVLVLAICRARWGQTSATRHERSQAAVHSFERYGNSDHVYVACLVNCNWTWNLNLQESTEQL